ncbi:PIN domain-containing protein [Candidatus Nitrososphaera gargensis Ga9.2]|uniref:PIN domain-containing protein n=1 Tax=Nitrososphaera gargensis (strain Ga9.2) TaxID=1237085 RepID=K0I6X2_NITGG|nr:type II toxin-antitoxin system VapC family toxin [Candidatus Nitrososphaera gargensis]AFU57011.1 PIN domain-containing protein [Candidatus Nitrososphaera gargensis Ga9.2]
MACFDSNFLIAWLQNDADALKKLEKLQHSPASTTMINAFELYKGIYRSKDKEKDIQKVKELLNSLELLTLDHESARMAGELDANMKSNTIGEADLLIASIVLTNGETLITRNTKHFERVPGLMVESW